MSTIEDAKKKIAEGRAALASIPEAEVHQEILAEVMSPSFQKSITNISYFVDVLPPGNIRNLLQGFVQAGQQTILAAVTMAKNEKAQQPAAETTTVQ